ncbi:MAG: hypothetical protein L6R39_007608 [Caloplaca ligustica]|nr:MAG: hypothetical protein L6R39_007608 [Caloplaca ligustica]
MYTQLPSIDSRMNAVTAWDDSFELQGAGKDELTVPLLAGYSPVPKTQPKATPIVLKAPVIQWAPLPGDVPAEERKQLAQVLGNGDNESD